uniref:PUM-HD domain-containing protein n=1 Tax=Noctiluca scintillans TaxID=2966 RepID=A0A7S1F8M4_NOCSC
MSVQSQPQSIARHLLVSEIRAISKMRLRDFKPMSEREWALCLALYASGQGATEDEQLRVRNTFLEYNDGPSRSRRDRAKTAPPRVGAPAELADERLRPPLASSAPDLVSDKTSPSEWLSHHVPSEQQSTKESSEDIWLRACSSKESSMTVQQALRSAAAKHRASSSTVRSEGLSELKHIASAFQGNVLKAATHACANYALQVLLEVAPVELIEFVPSACVNRGLDLCRHRIACRVMIRIVRHLLPNGSQAANQLVAELVAHSSRLSKHEYANYVMQALLDHGSNEHRREIVAGLSNGHGDELLRVALNRHGNCVIQRALRLCSAGITDGMVSELSYAGSILVQEPFGRYVARTVCSVLPSRDHRRQSLEYFLTWSGGVAMC